MQRWVDIFLHLPLVWQIVGTLFAFFIVYCVLKFIEFLSPPKCRCNCHNKGDDRRRRDEPPDDDDDGDPLTEKEIEKVLDAIDEAVGEPRNRIPKEMFN